MPPGRAACDALVAFAANIENRRDSPIKLARQALVRAVVAGTRSDDDDPIRLARQALVQLGFSTAIATRAVDTASAHVGARDLAELIKQALRHCR